MGRKPVKKSIYRIRRLKVIRFEPDVIYPENEPFVGLDPMFAESDQELSSMPGYVGLRPNGGSCVTDYFCSSGNSDPEKENPAVPPVSRFPGSLLRD